MHDVQSPRTDDGAIEQEIKSKGLKAPRVTPADIETVIASQWFFTAEQGCDGARITGTPLGEQPPVHSGSPLSLLTFCVLVLQNGFTVTGESACASPENFDAEIGRKVARANAVNKIWLLLGYALRDRLHNTPTDHRDRVRAEKADLDASLTRLNTFCSEIGGVFDALPTEEKQRLTRQQIVMAELSGVLGERIAAF